MFYLFSGDYYYPGGGWDDFIAAYGKFAVARRAVKDLKTEWWSIVDSTTLKEVAKGETDHFKEKEEKFRQSQEELANEIPSSVLSEWRTRRATQAQLNQEEDA